ncbi:hypothetical protein [Myxococcus sp. AB056]|uniref:hypothetical protein n=1 Tax=Myxococcus sp. AB056 TaxID=2562792 RepID=UPI00129C6979|nr:hypothetical protein [Myxococcus sp. AB056]
MPAVLANTLVPWFAKATRVTSVETLAPRLRRVRFEGESLKGVRAEPGHEVEFRVGPTAFRHDTPSLVDPARGALKVVVFFHAKAPEAAVVMLRQELLDRRGFAKRDVRSKAYWRDGKRGL